jgi:hypothetical protein
VQAARGWLQEIESGGYSAQLAAATQLAQQLESQEAHFRSLVGDPSAGPASQRSVHGIGRLLAVVKASPQAPPTTRSSSA